MKPTVTMEKKDSDVSTILSDIMQADIQQSSQMSNGKQWKWRTRFLVALVVMFIVVVAIVVGAVFLGIEITNDSTHTFQATYKTASQDVVDEKIYLSAAEVKFQIPGEVYAVFDFDKGLSMYMRRDEERSSCFLSTFNVSEGMAPRELKEYLEKIQIVQAYRVEDRRDVLHQFPFYGD